MVGSVAHPLAIAAHDLAFAVIVLGILLTMTGAFGDPNLVIVGLVVSIAGAIGILVEPGSTLVVLAAMIPVVGFLLFYLYRHVQYPTSESPDQTSSAASLVGKRGRVTERVTAREGEIELFRAGFDPHYRCRTEGEPIEVGEAAIVVSPGGGNVLTVAREDEVDMAELNQRSANADKRGWKVVDDVLDVFDRLRT